jgi:argininosuccinate synthase
MDRLVIPVLAPSAADAIADACAHGGLEVVGVVVDVGAMGGLDGLRDLALGAGARRCHVVDAREAVAERACWPALRAGALAPPGEPIAGALALPAVAEALVDIARHEGGASVAPWADTLGDRQRLHALVRGAAPGIGMVALAGPPRHGVFRNVWAAVETLAADDPAGGATPRAAAGAATVRIGFEHGFPRTLNGVSMPATDLIGSLETIVASHGMAAEVVRDPSTGTVWRVEAPAARALHDAFGAITAGAFDRRTSDIAAVVAEAYAAVVREGAWFSPVRRGLDGFVDRVLDGVSGDVMVRVVDGRIEVST